MAATVDVPWLLVVEERRQGRDQPLVTTNITGSPFSISIIKQRGMLISSYRLLPGFGVFRPVGRPSACLDWFRNRAPERVLIVDAG